MIQLSSTTQILEVTTSAAISLDYYVSYVDITTTAYTPGTSFGNISTATTTTIVAAPASSTQRQIKYITLRNRSTTTANTVSLRLDNSGTEYRLSPEITLAAGQVLEYSNDNGMAVINGDGSVKTMSQTSSGTTGYPSNYYKIGTASEAAASWYGTQKDAGSPGAFAVGTPGLNGRVTDGTTTTDAGCFPFKNAGTGSIYLTRASINGSTAHSHLIYDLLWINSGTVVTTTTGQSITTPTLPARDVNGSTNGEGCLIGLYVTAATTNAGAITNMTVTYTNSAGTGSRTATVTAVAGSRFPATAVVGTIVWFNLADGDTGVQSIQTLTLGTSLVTGSVSLFIARPIIQLGAVAANIGVDANIPYPGIRLYSGSCLMHAYISSATTATNVQANLTMVEI